MRSTVHHTSRTRRALATGLLVAVPLLPVAGCGDSAGDGGSGDSEVEDADTEEQQEGDGGAY